MPVPRLVPVLASVLAPVAVIAGAVIGVSLLIMAAGYDLPGAAHAAVAGSVGSSFAILSATLKRATPILMLGLAVAIAFRAGVLNIGAEGQFLAGAASACAVGLAAGPVLGRSSVFLELAVGATAGACWAGLAAVLKRWFSIMEVVSTLLLNFVAVHLVGYLIRGPLQEPSGSYPQSSLLEPAARLPLLLEGQRLHAGFPLALVIACLVWWFYRSTAAGFRFRVTGSSRAAAASAGLINVDAVQMQALIASGAIAGLAGACEVTGVTYALYDGLSPGYGYTAIAVALLGGLHPIAIIASATLFGALGAGADAMQRDAGVPAEFAAVAAALVVLGVLAVPSVRRFRLRTGGERRP
jgi:simple sugar transport system permease protein